MLFDPMDVLRWLVDRVWPWVCLCLVAAILVTCLLGIAGALWDVGPFVEPDGDPAAAEIQPVPREDPCVDHLDALAACAASEAAWREQAAQCVRDIVEVHR